MGIKNIPKGLHNLGGGVVFGFIALFILVGAGVQGCYQEVFSQDPQQPPQLSDDLSQLNGLDPIGQALIRERTKTAELEARIERLEWYIDLQRRQIGQLQSRVFPGYWPRGEIGNDGSRAKPNLIEEPEPSDQFEGLPPLGERPSDEEDG